jgi:hypothetical protein
MMLAYRLLVTVVSWLALLARSLASKDARKTPKITDVLPLLYLHGLSAGDFVPALG